MEQLAIEETKHTVGDLFRLHGGRGAPEVCLALLDAEIDGVDGPDSTVDVPMSVLEAPDESDAEALVGCDEASDPFEEVQCVGTVADRRR